MLSTPNALSGRSWCLLTHLKAHHDGTSNEGGDIDDGREQGGGSRGSLCRSRWQVGSFQYWLQLLECLTITASAFAKCWHLTLAKLARRCPSRDADIFEFTAK